MWGIKTKKQDLLPSQYHKSCQENATPQTSSQSITAPKNQHLRTIQQILIIISSYKNISKLFDINQLKHTQKLQIRKYKQSVYYGQISQFKRHGFGIMIYTTRRFYEGQWKQNMKSGQGYQQFINGSIYQGSYKNGKPDGYGKYLWENGQIYQGQWADGLKNGSGIWRGSKGDSYIGQWKDGKADGYGVHTWINGDRYEGEFVNCLKHGQGIQKFANGDTYKGSYDRGKPSGYGEYYWNDGSYFKGQFQCGLRNGKGIWKKNSGDSDKYEGQYVDDKKQGSGIYMWQNGNTYKGSYIRDFKQGYGQMFWNDGRKYKGIWKNDQPVDQNNIQYQVNPLSQEICEVHPFEEVLLFNPQNFTSEKSYDQPNHPAIYDQKSFRTRGMSSRQFSRNQISKTQATSRIYDYHMATQAIYKPKLMKKQSMNIKFQENGKPKKRFSHSVSQKKSMTSSFYMYKLQESKPIKYRKNIGMNQKQFIHSKPSKASLASRQRQIKSSSGIRNVGRKNFNNEQEEQFSPVKQFVWSKNRSQYF